MWNGPEKFISHVLLQSSFWILFSVMYILFARHLFWWWFCIATLRLWLVKWQLKHSKSLYLHLSGVWLANPQRKQRFLWWRRPTERPREHTLSRLTWFTPDEELSPWGFPPKSCTSFYAIFGRLQRLLLFEKKKLADNHFPLNLLCAKPADETIA